MTSSMTNSSQLLLSGSSLSSTLSSSSSNAVMNVSLSLAVIVTLVHIGVILVIAPIKRYYGYLQLGILMSQCLAYITFFVTCFLTTSSSTSSSTSASSGGGSLSPAVLLKHRVLDVLPQFFYLTSTSWTTVAMLMLVIEVHHPGITSAISSSGGSFLPFTATTAVAMVNAVPHPTSAAATTTNRKRASSASASVNADRSGDIAAISPKRRARLVWLHRIISWLATLCVGCALPAGCTFRQIWIFHQSQQSQKSQNWPMRARLTPHTTLTRNRQCRVIGQSSTLPDLSVQLFFVPVACLLLVQLLTLLYIVLLVYWRRRARQRSYKNVALVEAETAAHAQGDRAFSENKVAHSTREKLHEESSRDDRNLLTSVTRNTTNKTSKKKVRGSGGGGGHGGVGGDTESTCSSSSSTNNSVASSSSSSSSSHGSHLFNSTQNGRLQFLCKMFATTLFLWLLAYIATRKTRDDDAILFVGGASSPLRSSDRLAVAGQHAAITTTTTAIHTATHTVTHTSRSSRIPVKTSAYSDATSDSNSPLWNLFAISQALQTLFLLVTSLFSRPTVLLLFDWLEQRHLSRSMMLAVAAAEAARNFQIRSTPSSTPATVRADATGAAGEGGGAAGETRGGEGVAAGFAATNKADR